jgi:IclR family transcriptional regulator, acetate operon repressor
VLVAVARSPHGLTTKEITDELGISRQGTYHLIHTLVGAGFLARTQDGRYALGLKIGTLAAAFGRHLHPAEHLTPHVRALASASGETSYAAGWQGAEIVVVSVARGNRPVQAAEVVPGTAEDGATRASGKLLLAYAPRDLVDEYLATHPMRRRTPNTITDRARLDKEFELIREQGYSIDNEEFAEGLMCLAVPVDGGAAPFVIGLSVPAERFRSDQQGYIDMALKEAGLLSQ